MARTYLATANGNFWEEVEVPTDEASWDTANAVGTWAFPGGGVIQQTDNMVSPFSIWTNDDTPGLAWSLLFDARLDALDSTFGLAMSASVFPDPGVAPSPFGSYPGFGIDVGTSPGATQLAAGPAPQSNIGGLTVNVDIGDWHTYHGTWLGGLMSLAFDDDPTLQGFYMATSSSTLNMLGARLALAGEAAISFRNIQAWRIPIPTLP